ncbi:MAG: hypothetical protein RH862_03970 [Leptospiraceae bacterium]
MTIWEMAIITLVVSSAGTYLIFRAINLFRLARKPARNCSSSCGCSNDSR